MFADISLDSGWENLLVIPEGCILCLGGQCFEFFETVLVLSSQ